MVGAEPFCADALTLLSPKVAFDTIDNVLELVGKRTAFDQRRSERYELTQPVTVQPLDEKFEPTAFESTALTRDICSNGIGLICVKHFNTPYLRVTFDNCDEAAGNSLVLKIIHETPRGALYLLGGNIAIDWDLVDSKQSDLSDTNHPLFQMAILRDVRLILRD